MVYHDFFAASALVLCCFQLKTAYEVRISDWSSDVCSADLLRLDVAPGADQVVDRLAVVDALDRLFDDRPFVEVTGDEMRGRADQLHPALVRAVIRPRALEAGQEAVVDVDAATRELCRPVARQHLQLAREHPIKNRRRS